MAREHSIVGVTSSNEADAVALLQRFFAEEGFATPRPLIAVNFKTMLGDGSCWGALALADGRAIGIVTVTSILYVEWGRLGEISDLYVLPEFRRHGVARALVAAAIAWCRERGCASVSVVTTPEGEASHGLSKVYAKLGFVGTGRTMLVRSCG